MIDNKEITERLNAIENATPRGKTLAKRLIKFVLEKGDVSGDDLKAKMSKGRNAMTKNEYNTARNLAIEAGFVQQQGERRGARYISTAPKDGVVEEVVEEETIVQETEESTLDSSDTIEEIHRFALATGNILQAVHNTLTTKNSSYGNSVLDPINIFSQAESTPGLFVRLDDKLSRVKYGWDTMDTQQRLDTLVDLMGYLTLLTMKEMEE
tara:strand:- start:342 stop:971 length:630 start_codon:yes stop_codon:yes gene_type:complete